MLKLYLLILKCRICYTILHFLNKKNAYILPAAKINESDFEKTFIKKSKFNKIVIDFSIVILYNENILGVTTRIPIKILERER